MEIIRLSPPPVTTEFTIKLTKEDRETLRGFYMHMPTHWYGKLPDQLIKGLAWDNE